jgi:hypothetical protein
VNTLLGFLTITILTWLAAMIWVVVVALAHTLSLCRSRVAPRWSSGGLLGEMRQAELEFSIGIDRIDDAHHLARPRRHRFDAGVPSCPGGSGHAEV